MMNRAQYLPVILLAAMLIACGSGSKPKNGDKYEAIVWCEDYVKDRLKAPSTADFSDETVASQGRTWTVNGSVDAENSFGAKLRNSFACVVKYNGKDNYDLVKLTMPN